MMQEKNMKKTRPLIAVTPWYDYEHEKTYIRRGYMEGIHKAGGFPLLTSLCNASDTAQIMDTFDGVLLSGGPDIDARLYSEENMPQNEWISPLRDTFETALVKEAAVRGVPVFGICRGIQVINTAMGGGIYQDIYSCGKKGVLMHVQKAPKWYPVHDIRIEPGSFVHTAFNGISGGANSFHHQALREPAPGFRVTSRTSDGIIESIEHTELKFMAGVQWHPELMWQKFEEHLKLFRLFVDACRG